MGGERGLAEFLGHQSKRSESPGPGISLKRITLGPCLPCTFSSPAPKCQQCDHLKRQTSNKVIPSPLLLLERSLQQASFAFWTKLKSFNLAKTLPRAGPHLPSPPSPSNLTQALDAPSFFLPPDLCLSYSLCLASPFPFLLHLVDFFSSFRVLLRYHLLQKAFPDCLSHLKGMTNRTQLKTCFNSSQATCFKNI